MNSIYKTTRILTTLVVSLLLLPIQNVLANHEIIFTQEGGLACQTATFEGGSDLAQIHPENGNLIPGSIIGFPTPPPLFQGWLTVISGPFTFLNNPSGTVAATLTAPSSEILLDIPVTTATLHYSSASSVVVDAYDAVGSFLTSTSGPSNALPFDTFDILGVTAASDAIVRIVVTGAAGGTIIDDVKVCGLITPDALINSLVSNVLSLNLQKGIANSIDSKLDRALQALDDTNQNNDVAAVNALQAFINSVNAQRGNQISDDDANTMIAAAQAIISQLGT